MKIKIIFVIALFFSILSCTEVYNIELTDSKSNRLVVQGSFTSEHKKHKIILSRTGPYFLNAPTNRVPGANVTITDGDTIINLYDSENKGEYTTDSTVAGHPGKTYTLNIQLNNGQTYSASEYMKPLEPIDSMRYEYKKSDLPFDESYYYSINIFVQEPATVDDFYQWELFFNGESISDTVRTKTFVSDEMVNGVYIANWPVYQVPDYKLKTDTVDVTLQMLSISKAKYDFYLAIMLETDYSGAGFAGPPANVPTNISNGGLGFFSVSDVKEIKTVIYKVKK
ncbi:MAG: DUF4249 domain-containing protein [Bacteroidales bacterium]